MNLGVDAPIVFLAQAASPVEARVLAASVEEQRRFFEPDSAIDVVMLPFPRGREGDEEFAAALAGVVDRTDDPLLTPIRVAWLPKERKGGRSARVSDLFVVGDPRRPHRIAQEVLSRRANDRLQVVLGEPARLSELRRVWEHDAPDGPSPESFARFIGRHATLALERAEARRLGPHYKVPRLVHEEIVASARYRDGLARLAIELDRPREELESQADQYLDEMVTGFGTLQIDVNQQLGTFLYQLGYDAEVDVDPAQVDRFRAALSQHAGVILPTHRSNLDAGVMPATFHRLGLPKAHTLAGINVAFWPLAPIMRRSGVIFIRRDTRDNPLYRWVLREYIGYLVEKRFHLEWYIEGGRSRTGKLLPPKLGLLTYVVDAYREGRTDDVVLIPASISYDRLREVSEYAGEARGRQKKAENAGWFLRYARSLRGRYGRIYVRFGEPLSLRETLGPPDGPEQSASEGRLALQKLAFEVSWRINNVTPITAASLVTMTLLSTPDEALTFEQLALALARFLAFATDRNLPMTETAAQLAGSPGLTTALEALADQGVVRRFANGREAVYLIDTDQHLAAAFYRNSILHFFLEAAVCELALVAASEAKEDRLEAFWSQAWWLRDNLKFDFFFLERDQFREAIGAELARTDPSWPASIAARPTGPRELLAAARSPHGAHGPAVVLRGVLHRRSHPAMAGRRCEPRRRRLPRGLRGTGPAVPAATTHQEWRSRVAAALQDGPPAGRAPQPRGQRRPGRAAARAFVAELRDVLRRFDVIEGFAQARFAARLRARR